MTVAAASRPAQPFGPQEVIRFLRQNEDGIVIAGLLLLIVATTGIALLANVATSGDMDTGVCFQRVHSLPGYLFPTLH
jgi:hypothetical protein